MNSTSFVNCFVWNHEYFEKFVKHKFSGAPPPPPPENSTLGYMYVHSYGPLSEDRKKFKQIYQNYLVALTERQWLTPF